MTIYVPCISPAYQYFCICRVTYKDASNQVVLSRLVREVRALNPVFLTQHLTLPFAHNETTTMAM